MKPYVHSNYVRKENDDYQTVDLRCVQALVDTISLWGEVVDCCSPNGSGIVNHLLHLGYNARGLDDAFAYVNAHWIVSNPPYKKGLVDKIINAQLDRLGDVEGVCMLLRNNFDFAKSRWNMFAANCYYYGQIHMLFRPKWFTEDKASPIHNFVWHIWRLGTLEKPVVEYWREK